ncbi:hypothetical protein P3F01_11120 [Clostridium perfringens]|uniref:hypothetical protein n=1 Tax=Clostridium perfringens TaxID=1502 RepID=UPI0028E0FF11|nr:hypothetical protein [Clostridium perfringens]MDT9336923.1 hypothetical protein [Clostridium perfringens]MDT9344679.1 hypothetical protein [Clostridium perfringens]MDT9347922.1 hypothetical protein [Clostridium perfringens]MDT9353614.1 hypothetical protein [Clostridium perfringens]
MDTIENKLKELILTKYKSLREFTLKIGMPYSTFDTILKRGVDKANIINILKICNELDISADKLANGIIEYNNVEKDTYSINLSKEETTLLENYNKLNKFGKNKVINYTKDLIEMPKYQKDNNVTALHKREKQIWEEPGKEYLMPIACHDDGLTDEEKENMNNIIDNFLKNKK